jgi:hypothetical protein
MTATTDTTCLLGDDCAAAMCPVHDPDNRMGYIAQVGQVVALVDGPVGTVIRSNACSVREREGVYYEVLLTDGTERSYMIFVDEPEHTYRRVVRVGVRVAIPEPVFTVVDVAALLAGAQA